MAPLAATTPLSTPAVAPTTSPEGLHLCRREVFIDAVSVLHEVEALPGGGLTPLSSLELDQRR